MVALAYVETSALVKLYDPREPGSAGVVALLRRYQGCSSVLLFAEVVSALARKRRAREVTDRRSQALLAQFKRDYQQLVLVELSPRVLQETERLLLTYPLRAADAIHLASAVLLREHLPSPLPVITADRAIAEAARQEQFTVLPESLPVA